jgi:hypothetical protein
MDTQEAIRKSFPVKVVQVTLQNIEEVAEWCGGTIAQRPTRMLGTETLLPVIQLKTQVGGREREFDATLGSWVVELNGSFRAYKHTQFMSSFDLLPSLKPEVPEDSTSDLGIYDSGDNGTPDPESFLKIV